MVVCRNDRWSIRLLVLLFDLILNYLRSCSNWRVKTDWRRIPPRKNKVLSGPKRRTYAVKRIPPSRKLKQLIGQMLEGYETELPPLDALTKLGARYMLQKSNNCQGGSGNLEC
jgi:hypothetical protein